MSFKQFFLYKCIFIILFYGAFTSFQTLADELALNVITEDWAPYNYEENNILKGFSVEVVKTIMAELGEKHHINIYPGARGEMMLDTKPNIMNFSLFRTPEREIKYKWVGPISEESIYFYKRKDDTREYKTLNDVRENSIIAAPHKGLVSSYIEALGITNINKLSNRTSQFLHLFVGRANLMVNLTPLGVAYYLKQLNKPVDTLVQTQVKLLEFPLYIACSKEIPDSVIRKWQNALDRIKSSGKYDQIYNKYLR